MCNENGSVSSFLCVCHVGTNHNTDAPWMAEWMVMVLDMAFPPSTPRPIDDDNRRGFGIFSIFFYLFFKHILLVSKSE